MSEKYIWGSPFPYDGIIVCIVHNELLRPRQDNTDFIYCDYCDTKAEFWEIDDCYDVFQYRLYKNAAIRMIEDTDEF